MRHSPALKHHLQIRHDFAVQFLSILVAAHGLFILSTILLEQIAARRSTHLSSIVIDLPLLIGVSLVYLSTQLWRRKRNAWLVTILAYTLYLGFSVTHLIIHANMRQFLGHELVRAVILPIVVLGLLLIFERQYIVRSDIQGLRTASRFAIIMLLLALVYGVTGFLLLDNSDFHQEIGPVTAAHYTLDQFDLTTAKPLHAYTRRAQLFVDSLSVVSTGAIVYAVIALFQPLRSRLTDQETQRQHLYQLLSKYGGVALCLGDPSGDTRQFDQLWGSFAALCFNNGWLLGAVHAEASYQKLYESHNFNMQKIGQEAIVNLEHFQTRVKDDKYFRQIDNRFTKQGFSCEVLMAPHHQAVIERLQAISDQWLARDSHAERGFAMGYFSNAYMQNCQLLVLRDAAGTIQAFMNQLPAPYDKDEADFDLLRSANDSPSNSNDYLLMNFIERLHTSGYKRLNMGLCALTGLEETDAERKNLIDTALKFAYANGGRFFSFGGLYRFKNKYQPEWRDRYIVYQGGLRGFSRTTTALMRAMRVK